MNIKPVESLREFLDLLVALLDYMENEMDEKKHYEECYKAERKNHIYVKIVKLRVIVETWESWYEKGYRFLWLHKLNMPQEK